jgi:hypothetical protein
LRATSPSSARIRDPDDIALRFYIERKADLETVTERKELAGDVMPHLAAVILTQGLEATISPRRNKVPVECPTIDGILQHPSGFVPPTPAQFHLETGVVPSGLTAAFAHADQVPDITVPPFEPRPGRQTKVRDEAKPAGAAMPTPPPSERTSSYHARELHTTSSTTGRPTIGLASAPTKALFHMSTPRPQATSRRQPDEDVTMRYYIERKAERESVVERKTIEGDLMPGLSASIISDGFDAEIKAQESKVPVEILAADGTVTHASGFVPPTPAEFHEATGVVSHGLQAHKAHIVDPATDATVHDGVPVDIRNATEQTPAGDVKPTLPPSSPSGQTASSYGARV